MPDIHIDHPSALLTFFVLTVGGMFFSYLFHKLKLPEMIGLLGIGFVLGPTGLNIFDLEAINNIHVISDIALGLMTFTVGTHINYKSLHNSWKRILNLAIFDITITYFIVFTLLTLFSGLSLTTRLLVSSLAISTSPGTILHLIHGKRARGMLVKTLLGVVALNNVGAIIIFEVCKKIAVGLEVGSGSIVVIQPLLAVALAISIGLLTGLLLNVITRHVHREADLLAITFLVIIFNILFSTGIGGISPLLVNLATGIVIGNLSYHNKRIVRIFDGLNVILFTVFFTMAGTHLHLDRMTAAGVAGGIFIFGRIFGKIIGSYLGGKMTNASAKIVKNLGMALIPQGGLAVGLVISLEYNEIFKAGGNESIAAIVSTIVLAAVTFNEIIGPITTGRAFDNTGETNQDNPRLVNFLHEEYIMVPLEAKDKWEAIEKMCNFMVKTHHLKHITREELTRVVIKREKECSTGLGSGIALPHARITSKESLMGVIGIMKEPIDFESLDGQKVSVIILVATPEDQIDQHLKVCQTVATIFTRDTTFFENLIKCGDAAEVYDLLQSEQVRDQNYFLTS